jgi:hypothetical protein
MNIAPKFSPTIVNRPSTLKIQYTPSGSDRYVQPNTGSAILQLPPLPVSLPKSYLLPRKGLECFVGLDRAQTCYSYPEIGWILIYKFHDVKIKILKTIKYIFFFLEFTS